jgi:putative ubiquitin-RnfH superfamily antitoxin RatB of RatAB toxin-antitoxin module
MRGAGSIARTGDTITVEVAYGLPSRQVLLTVEIPPGATVRDAIAASGIENELPDLEVDADRVGVFGQKVALDHTLESGDRVEIYRPLLIDPKEARRARADAARGAE